MLNNSFVFDYTNIKSKEVLKNFIVNAEPNIRKQFIKSLNNEDFIRFIRFIMNNKLASKFKCRNIKNISIPNTKGNYLYYFYFMMMTNIYDVDFEPFYNFYDLNDSERDYMNRLFYVDIDYKEKEKPINIVKNILQQIYTVNDIIDYISLKFNNINNSLLYRKLKKSLEWITNNPNCFKLFEHDIDRKLKLSFTCNFNNQMMNQILNYPTKTSVEPVIGFARSFKTSPTLTTDLPLMKTTLEPVIDTALCESPNNILVCKSHLSPTLTTDLPLMKTSLEPDIDFLGGYGK